MDKRYCPHCGFEIDPNDDIHVEQMPEICFNCDGNVENWLTWDEWKAKTIKEVI